MRSFKIHFYLIGEKVVKAIKNRQSMTMVADERIGGKNKNV
jgi:hypothetical protein